MPRAGDLCTASRLQPSCCIAINVAEVTEAGAGACGGSPQPGCEESGAAGARGESGGCPVPSAPARAPASPHTAWLGRRKKLPTYQRELLVLLFWIQVFVAQFIFKPL